MNLADMQRSGYGMPKDPATAVQRMKKALEIFRSAASGSTATEDVRRLLVQAQAAIREKQFQEAEGLLREARRHEPWSPMCWYNLALVQGELQRFGDAMWDMQVFLMLAPDAPQARGGQDLIYEWERKVRK
jgi:Flp pilus assembly protein TadD